MEARQIGPDGDEKVVASRRREADQIAVQTEAGDAEDFLFDEPRGGLRGHRLQKEQVHLNGGVVPSAPGLA
jgi:hypothetical protein